VDKNKPSEPQNSYQHVTILPPQEPSEPLQLPNLKNTLSPQQEPLNNKVET